MSNPETPNSYNFNNQDYDFVFRLYNDVNDLYLTNTIWEDLYLEEDIFDWKIKGSVVIKSPYESFERESEEAISISKGEKNKIIYKFRNDARDTLFISIKPKIENFKNTNIDTKDSIWRLELEAVIYDVEELQNDDSKNKYKKLYFWEKTYQLMREKDCSFSTAIVGENINKKNLDQLDNHERSLQTGTAISELLNTDSLFSAHAKLTKNKETWDDGFEQSKIYYTNPVGYKFIDALDYLYRYHISSSSNEYQPCILKFERAEKSLEPKQFSLKSLKSYFEKAGNQINNPKEYQIEHFFIYGHSESKKGVPILKAPLNKDSFKTEFKADDFSNIREYKIVDMSGLFYSENLCNYRITSYNRFDGQFNEEVIQHNAEDSYKEFYKKNIKNNLITQNSEDRLPISPFIKNGINTKTINSLRTDQYSRLADGKNIIIKHYLFSNLAINFSIKGSTHRQTGRFFAVSKTADNNTDFDNKLEGQYFITNIIHHFNNASKSYTNQLLGVKTQSFKESTKFESSDVNIIKYSSTDKTLADTNSLA